MTALTHPDLPSPGLQHDLTRSRSGDQSLCNYRQLFAWTKGLNIRLRLLYMDCYRPLVVDDHQPSPHCLEMSRGEELDFPLHLLHLLDLQVSI